MHRGLAAGSGDCTDAAFERRDPLLEHRVGRIGDARVDVACPLHVEQRSRLIGVLEDVRRREVHRLRSCAKLRIGLLPRMQAQRVELVRLRSRHDFFIPASQSKSKPNTEAQRTQRTRRKVHEGCYWNQPALLPFLMRTITEIILFRSSRFLLRVLRVLRGSRSKVFNRTRRGR